MHCGIAFRKDACHSAFDFVLKQDILTYFWTVLASACDAFWMQFLRCDSWSRSQMCRLRSFTSENLLGTNIAMLLTSLWHAVLISCSCCDRRGEYTLKKLFQVRLCGSNSLSLSFFLSLFALLSKKHNKVLEQATQSLRGPVGADDTTVLPDYVSQSLNHFTVNQCESIHWFTKSLQFSFSKCNVIKS